MRMRRGRLSTDPRNVAAFEAEALALVDTLYRTALRLTRVSADAEDLVQDTYLTAKRRSAPPMPSSNQAPIRRRLKRFSFATHSIPTSRPPSTRCPTCSVRPCGYETWKSFPMRKSPECLRFPLER